MLKGLLLRLLSKLLLWLLRLLLGLSCWSLVKVTPFGVPISTGIVSIGCLRLSWAAAKIEQVLHIVVVVALLWLDHVACGLHRLGFLRLGLLLLLLLWLLLLWRLNIATSRS